MAQSPVNSQLDTILVTANKLNQNRKEAPIAISILSATTLKKENVTRIDFLLNKVPGVYMPSILKLLKVPLLPYMEQKRLVASSIFSLKPLLQKKQLS